MTGKAYNGRKRWTLKETRALVAMAQVMRGSSFKDITDRYNDTMLHNRSVAAVHNHLNRLRKAGVKTVADLGKLEDKDFVQLPLAFQRVTKVEACPAPTVQVHKVRGLTASLLKFQGYRGVVTLDVGA